MADNDKIKQTVFAVVGPTACGKTALSVEVAKRIGAEIVCCDSMQIYSGMSIGTAAPTPTEMSEVRHHLFGTVDPHIMFSCADYAEMADRAIADITSRGKIPMFVGGTGLYLDSVILGCGDESAAPDPLYREELQNLCAEKGADELYRLLEAADPEAALKIHKNNVKRVIRALEICRACGTKSEYDRRSRNGLRYNICAVCLVSRDRQHLYSRIDSRVEKMMDDGLCEETVRLMNEGVFEENKTAAGAIGYKEILPYIKGEEPIEAAVQRLKTATRHYAKRQMTWFSSKDYMHYLDCDGIEDPIMFEETVKTAADLFESKKIF